MRRNTIYNISINIGHISPVTTSLPVNNPVEAETKANIAENTQNGKKCDISTPNNHGNLIKNETIKHNYFR